MDGGSARPLTTSPIVGTSASHLTPSLVKCAVTTPISDNDIERQWTQITTFAERLAERSGSPEEFRVADGSDFAGDDASASRTTSRTR